MLQALSNLQNSLSYDADCRGPRQRDRLCALCAGAQQEGLGRRPALLCRHASSRPSRARWRSRSLPRASRSTATRSAPRRPSRPRCSWPSRQSGTRLLPLRLWLARCATARRCWRSPPKASRCRPIVPELIKLVGERTQRDPTGPARRTMPGCCWPRVPCAANAADMQLTVNGAPHTGIYSERFDGSDLVDSPVTIANAGNDAVQAVVTTVAAPAQPLAGRRRRLRHRAHLLHGSTAARPMSRRSRRTSASSSC